MEEISSNLFSGCENLQDITIPDSAIVISTDTFRNCTSLTAITIGTGIIQIDDAFYGCDNLGNIYIYATTPPDLSRGAISTNTIIHVPNGTTAAYQNAWGSEYTFEGDL